MGFWDSVAGLAKGAGQAVQEKAKEQAITARLVEGPVAPVMPSTAQEVDVDSEMDDRTRSLIASTLFAFRSRG